MADITKKTVLKLIQSQQYRCALTGLPLTPPTANLDHVVPLSQGGTHEIENCQVLRADINRAKGTLNNDEFIALCKAVVHYAESGHLETEDANMPLLVGPSER